MYNNDPHMINFKKPDVRRPVVWLVCAWFKSGNGLSLVIRSSALAGMANRTVSITYVHTYLCTYEYMRCTIHVSTRQKKSTITLVKSSSVQFYLSLFLRTTYVHQMSMSAEVVSKWFQFAWTGRQLNENHYTTCQCNWSLVQLHTFCDMSSKSPLITVGRFL